MSTQLLRSAAAIGLTALVVLTFAACSNDDNGGALGASSGATAPPASTAALTVDVTTAGRTRHATITCNGAQATGTAFLADPAVAMLACKALADPAANARLVASTRATDCPTGLTLPATAHVTGTLHGIPIDTTLDRANPCDAASWDLLTFLLGPPGG